MTNNKLKVVLENHQKWINGEKDGICANLSGANLRDADLCDANLYYANLLSADLRGANLLGANLYHANLYRAKLLGANLRDADLRNADLRNADLCNANLSDANLRDADLRNANLSGANLHNADLCDADLSGANLRDANLCGANLGDANLCDANLCGANLFGVKNIPFLPQLIICPPEGSFTAYKKLANSCIAKLLIPEDAKRSNATTRKCRCDKALVVAIYDNNGNEIKHGFSRHDDTFHYEVGQMVRVDNFDENRWNECSTGIHFFMSKQEAIDY